MKFLLLLAVLTAAFMYWRKDRGRPHTQYFQKLQALLKKNRISHPRLVIDLDRVDANIEQVRRTVKDTSSLRIVAKSLPSIEMLEYLQNKLGTNRLMAFHQPFLNQMLDRFPQADFLVGKPFPVDSARWILEQSDDKCRDATDRVKWLVDTLPRLEQYLELAKEKKIRLKVSLEIDVGLHRGGVGSPAELHPLLKLLAENTEHLQFTGFMGYEPYISKLKGYWPANRKRRALPCWVATRPVLIW